MSYFKSAHMVVSAVIALLGLKLIYDEDLPLYNFVDNPVLTGKIFIALALVISALYFVSNIKKR